MFFYSTVDVAKVKVKVKVARLLHSKTRGSTLLHPFSSILVCLSNSIGFIYKLVVIVTALR